MANNDRVRRRVRVTDTHSDILADMRAVVDDIMTIQERVSELQAEIARKTLELGNDLELYKIKEVVATKGAAVYVTPGSKATRTVVVRLFRGLVSEEDFLQAASVTIGDAKKFLSEKQLDSVCTTTPAVEKDPELKLLTMAQLAKIRGKK